MIHDSWFRFYPRLSGLLALTPRQAFDIAAGLQAQTVVAENDLFIRRFYNATLP